MWWKTSKSGDFLVDPFNTTLKLEAEGTSPQI